MVVAKCRRNQVTWWNVQHKLSVQFIVKSLTQLVNKGDRYIERERAQRNRRWGKKHHQKLTYINYNHNSAERTVMNIAQKLDKFGICVCLRVVLAKLVVVARCVSVLKQLWLVVLRARIRKLSCTFAGSEFCHVLFLYFRETLAHRKNRNQRMSTANIQRDRTCACTHSGSGSFYIIKLNGEILSTAQSPNRILV